MLGAGDGIVQAQGVLHPGSREPRLPVVPGPFPVLPLPPQDWLHFPQQEPKEKKGREREGGKEKLKNLSSLINEASQPGEHVWDRRPPARGEPAARAGDMEEERWGGMGGDRHGFLYSPVN